MNFLWRIAGNGYQDPDTENPKPENPKRWEDPQADEHQNHQYASQWDANGSSMNDADKAALDMVSVHRHFLSLERQQLSIMEMLQVQT